MQRPVAVETNVPGGSIVVDVANIARVDPKWVGGRFGARIDFNNGNFITVSQGQLALLQNAGMIPQV
jgi:hypothetical protein